MNRKIIYILFGLIISFHSYSQGIKVNGNVSLRANGNVKIKTNNIAIGTSSSVSLSDADLSILGTLTIDGSLSSSQSVVLFNGSSTQNIEGANQNIAFDILEISPGSDIRIASGSTLSANQFNLTGTSSQNISISSTTSGSQAFLSKSTGTVEGDFLVLQDIHAIGGATFNANNSTNNGNNDGWSFGGNTPPVVANPIANQSLTEGFGTSTLSIAGVFNDVDGDNLSYSVVSDNTDVITVSIQGEEITFTEQGLGTATVEVIADDGNQGTITDSFIVNVQSANNNAPVVSNPLEDQNLTNGFIFLVISLEGVFSDDDGDQLTYAVSSSNSSVVSASITSEGISIEEVGVGSAIIEVTANDGRGGTAIDAFVVSVNTEGNNPPTVAEEIGDKNYEGGFGSSKISLVDIFSDEDGDNLTFSAISSVASVVTVSTAGSILTISETGPGSSIIEVIAEDGFGGFATTDFTVNVEESTLSVDQVLIGLLVYPNPVSDLVTIKVSSGIRKFELSDISGKSVTFDLIYIEKSEALISLKNLPKGVYFVTCETPNGNFSKRIIKE